MPLGVIWTKTQKIKNNACVPTVQRYNRGRQQRCTLKATYFETSTASKLQPGLIYCINHKGYTPSLDRFAYVWSLFLFAPRRNQIVCVVSSGVLLMERCVFGCAMAGIKREAFSFSGCLARQFCLRPLAAASSLRKDNRRVATGD